MFVENHFSPGEGGGGEFLLCNERKRYCLLKKYNQLAVFSYAADVPVRNLRVICAVCREIASVDRVTERD